MNNSYIKNIDHEEIISLSGQVSVQQGQIVSKTLAQNKAVSITLFAFDKDEEISTHASDGDAMVTVLEGVGEFTVGEDVYTLKEGETVVMSAQKPHAVFAKEAFKMLLVVIFPSTAEKE